MQNVYHFDDDTNICLSNSIKKLNKVVNDYLKHLVNWLNAKCEKKTETVIFKSNQKKTKKLKVISKYNFAVKVYILLKLLNTYNRFHNILRLFNVFANFPFTESETKRLFVTRGHPWRMSAQIWEFLGPLPSPTPPVQACPHLVDHPPPPHPSPCLCGHKTGIIWNIGTCEQFTLKGKKTDHCVWK